MFLWRGRRISGHDLEMNFKKSITKWYWIIVFNFIWCCDSNVIVFCKYSLNIIDAEIIKQQCVMWINFKIIIRTIRKQGGRWMKIAGWWVYRICHNSLSFTRVVLFIHERLKDFFRVKLYEFLRIQFKKTCSLSYAIMYTTEFHFNHIWSHYH